MTPNQVVSLVNGSVNGTVNIGDEDYMALRVVEDPLEEVAVSQVSGRCTKTDLMPFTDPAALRYASTQGGGSLAWVPGPEVLCLGNPPFALNPEPMPGTTGRPRPQMRSTTRARRHSGAYASL